MISDRQAVAGTWQLDAGGSDVLVTGPELARTARVTGARLELTGDTRKAGRLRVFAPAGVNTAGHALVWLNGHYLGAQGDGTATHTVPAGLTAPGRPAVLAVLVRNMRQYEDWSSDGRSKGGPGGAGRAVSAPLSRRAWRRTPRDWPSCGRSAPPWSATP
ncbi:hypothetical protein OG261_05380 [Streptomyces sp. NBC_01358]